MNSETLVYTVPIDVVIDIAEILVESRIQHSIKAIKEEKHAIVLRLLVEPEHAKAVENIEKILEEYNHLLAGTADH